MTENTKIQMFKTKVYAMINKLNCLNCGKSDNTTKVSTKKLLCSKWCCQKEETTRERVIKSKQGFDETGQVISPHKNHVDCTYKCWNWCSRSQ